MNEKLSTKIESAAKEAGKDLYLESLYSTLEMCDLILQNSQVLPDEQVLKAQKLRKETQGNIQKREAIPKERRLGN